MFDKPFCQAADAAPLVIPYLDVPDALPLNCLLNCEEQVERCGGNVVTGWKLGDHPCWTQHLHHAVWKSPAGSLFEITPTVIAEDGQVCFTIKGRSSWFIVDPEAQFIGEKPFRRALPSRFFPKEDHALLFQVCDFMTRSEKCLYGGEYERAAYWNQRAESVYNRFAAKKGRGRLRFVMPSRELVARHGFEGVQEMVA